MTILVAGNNIKLNNNLYEALSNTGYHVHNTTSLDETMARITQNKPDLVLIDETLTPDAGELRRIKSPTSQAVALMVLGEESCETHVVRAFDNGADDYINKQSLSPNVLIRRIRAVTQRFPALENYHWRGIELQQQTHRVFVHGHELQLTLMEFTILKTLLKIPGHVFSRQAFLDAAKAQNVTARTVDVHVCSLRKKLRPLGEDIKTVRGVGYRLPT